MVTDLLTQLSARGITLRPNGDRLRIEAPEGELTDADMAAITASKAELLTVLAYRDALHRVWTLMAEAAKANPVACKTALEDVVRLTDEVGMPAALRLRHRWEVEWHRVTGRCPRCGEFGELHPPETA